MRGHNSVFRSGSAVWRNGRALSQIHQSLLRNSPVPPPGVRNPWVTFGPDVLYPGLSKIPQPFVQLKVQQSIQRF